ncbi:site-specific integrase [Bradyrhizobium sp. Ec3.3]|uniref:site-specific integrase n=1 Tax=Bradyrhizobium sp. Ec3.3 TaxID=189753 RepID=UPI0004107868|nr:site-specific integrase [Bradyrhizobium sp. Ec3.3]
MMMPERDWTWLRDITGRLHAAVPKSTVSAPVITSIPVLKLGLELMIESQPLEGGKLTESIAAGYRNGLMIALLAFIPLRAKNCLGLEIGRHLVREQDEWFIIIPRSETKTRTPIEFAVPEILNEYLELYLEVIRPWLQRGRAGDALWLSRQAEGALSHQTFGRVLARLSSEHLGLRLSPHDLRDAAATTWAIAKPSQIAVSKDLLAHNDLRTTTRHYNRARGIEASRAQARLIAELRKRRTRC